MVKFSDNTNQSNVVELRNIKQSYDGGKNYVLNDFDLLIEDKPDQGQFVCILGLSGCGKSTILRYVAGLQQPTEGIVKVKGKPVGADNRVSMVFQQYSSFPWMTVLDNVSLALRFKGISEKERNERAMELIKLVGLEGHEKKYAQYPSLSGGQLQRVAIARSLLANPEIILMDEPFGALDINTRIRMQNMLSTIYKDIQPTIIFVTHDIAEAVYLGDDIYIMKAPPSKIVHHVKIDLPLERTRAIKRDPRFVNLVHEVEDLMIGLYNEAKMEM